MMDLLWLVMAVILVLNLASMFANYKRDPFVAGINLTTALWILIGMAFSAIRSML